MAHVYTTKYYIAIKIMLSNIQGDGKMFMMCHCEKIQNIRCIAWSHFWKQTIWLKGNIPKY